MQTRSRLLLWGALFLWVVAGAVLPVTARREPRVSDERALPRSTDTITVQSAQDLPPGGEGLRNQVILQPGAGDETLLKDTHILEYHPDDNHGADGGFQLRSGGGTVRTLMRWDRASLPEGAHVESAQLEIYASSRALENAVSVSVYKMLRDWSEGSATWNRASSETYWHKAGCDGLGTDHAVNPVVTLPLGATDSIPRWYTWDITELVQEWVDAPESNFGLILIAAGSLNYHGFLSSEAGATALRPRLWLTYSPAATTTPTASGTPTHTLTPSVTHTAGPSPTPTHTAGPSPTPTETPISWIDTSRLIPAACSSGAGSRYDGDTTGKPNNASRYGTITWDEAGPEDVYVLQKTVVSDLSVYIESLSGADLDVFLLYSPDPAALLEGGNTGFTYRNLAPGTYYVVVDGYAGAMGAYRLYLTCAGEPTPTATITPTPSPTNTPAYSYYPLVYKQPTPTPTQTNTPTVTPTVEPYDMAVNCGATEWFVGSENYGYSPDKIYTEGTWGWDGGSPDNIWTTGSGIADTVDDPIYQVHRYAMNAYRFAVPNGRYRVILRFAEIFRFISPGGRVFAVDLEGQRILEQFDMLGVGARNRAFDVTSEVDVVDGRLDITFEQQSLDYAPAISGIRLTRIQ